MSRMLVRPDGAAISFQDVGAGLTILFSHGLLMDRDMFDPQVACFRRTHRCVTWDQRSHGDTRWSGPYSFWDSANDAIALLDHLDIDRAVLVGMSQGGLLSLRAALVAPDRITGLVMIASQAGTLRPDTAVRLRAFADSWTASGPDQRSLDWMANLILGVGVDHAYWQSRWAKMEQRQVRDALRTLSERDDLTGRLRNIVAPALVVHGSADTSTSVESARFVAEHLSNCRGFVLIDGGPHAVNLSHADQVNNALADFLVRL